MPPWRQAHPSRTQLRLRLLRREDLRQWRNKAAAHLRAAAELLTTRGPRRSLRIEWLWYNAPALAAGQAPWYRLVLFGEENFFQQGFCLTATGSSWVTTGMHRRTPITKELTRVLHTDLELQQYVLSRGGQSCHRHYTGGPYRWHTGHDHTAASLVLQI